MTSSTSEDNRLDLLLADAEERRPVLEHGLPGEAVQDGPRPKKAARGDDSPHWRRTDADPNDLPAQRWGVVVPEGREGSRLLEAISPLVRLREAEQRAPVRIYRAPPDLDARLSVAWKDEVYWAEDVPEDERPLYLLLLGDLHQLSAELQHSLANGALAGRIHFADTAGETDLNGYAAYAEKVARFATQGTSEPSPDMLFFVAQDDTQATQSAEARLVRPSLAAVREGQGKGQFPVASVRELAAETTDELLSAGASARPSVLLSVSHGLGPPRRGFRSEEEQQQRQGALMVGQGQVLDAEQLRGQHFLPGGMWFCLACFGAGTPAESVYEKWLLQLSKQDAYSGKVEDLRKSLPPKGQRPFVAAMPQAALGNPQGPLALIGHIDLAWTYGFSSAKKLSESRKGRILSALQVMVRGGRAGVALEALMRYYRETNDALMASYDLEAAARHQGRADPTDPVERAHLWMLRNDLRGYVLLGDPAAQLPQKAHANLEQAKQTAPAELCSSPAAGGSVAGEPPGAQPPGGRGEKLSVREAAVIALFQGDEPPRAIAARAGVSLETLWAWFDAYRAGGRARIDS